MSQSFARIADIVLPVAGGAGNSNVIELRRAAEDAVCLHFGSPSDLDVVTCTILVSIDGGVTYFTLQFKKSDGTLGDYPFPAAGKSMVVPVGDLGGATHMKIHAGGAIVTSAKTIQLGKSWTGL